MSEVDEHGARIERIVLNALEMFTLKVADGIPVEQAKADVLRAVRESWKTGARA